MYFEVSRQHLDAAGWLNQDDTELKVIVHENFWAKVVPYTFLQIRLYRAVRDADISVHCPPSL